MANSADPDQLALQKPTDQDLHCLPKKDISGFSRTRVYKKKRKEKIRNSINNDDIFLPADFKQYCLFVLRLYDQSTQWGHVKHGQFI